jgi:tripartite-type tricarboxylate transporter receptor subunit TctC
MNAVSMLASFFLALSATATHAQPYPAKPIRLTIGFPPGSPPDIVGRAFAEQLGEQLKQQVVVENRPGVGGTLAAAVTASAAPDGYSLHLGTTGSLAVGPAFYPNAGFDPLKSFAPVAQITSAPALLLVSAALPVTTVRELIEYTRARPGRVNYASAGNGSLPHILMEMFKSLSGADLVHVAYKNAPEAYVGLLSGDVVAFVDQPVTADPHVRAGKARYLAIAKATRHPSHPSIPTTAEAGVPGFEAELWFGLVAPVGTPRDIIDRLNAATQQSLAAGALRERLANISTDPVGGTSEQFAAVIARDVAWWARAVKLSGAKVE